MTGHFTRMAFPNKSPAPARSIASTAPRAATHAGLHRRQIARLAAWAHARGWDHLTLPSTAGKSPSRNLQISHQCYIDRPMDAWRVEVLNEIVQAEIAALPLDIRTKLTHIADLMAAVGPQQMREPHVKPLGDKLWEMRMSGRDGIARAIYVLALKRRIVILHAFVKKTQKTPPAAVRLALKRARELER